MKCRAILLSVILPVLSFGQITITSNDMPAAGDTARFTNAIVNPLINFAATGANHNWNFSNLRNNGQDLKEEHSVSSTGIIYALFFSNLPFNPNRATVAETGQTLPSNPLLNITDPYNFYFRSSSVFKQVGFGAGIAGIPTPIAYSQHDVIYHLPLNYNNKDSSYAAWHIGLPGIGYYGFTQTRINFVDGWGTLVTPHATYNVLRVKTELYAKDTISVDTLNLNFAINRPKTTQYKWLANNEIIPVLQITTTEVLGVEIVTEIRYRDDYNTIHPTNLNVAYCTASSINIPYLATGSYNGQAFLQQPNVFTAQLSDATGSFVNPVNIGTVTSRVSGTITAVIPANTLPGSGYRIRIVSSSPAVTGNDNGFNIRIENNAVASIIANGPLTFCQGGSVELQTVVTDSGYTYQWLENNIPISAANNSTYMATASGVYKLNVTNSCGTVTSGSISVTVDPLPSAGAVSTTLTAICPGDSVMLTTTSSATSLTWLLNGTVIAGVNTTACYATAGGDYAVVVTNGCGTDTSAAITLTMGIMPTAVVTTSGVVSFCSGDSVVLTAASGNDFNYQWLVNGVYTGDSTQVLVAVADGVYQAEVTNSCGASLSSAVTVTVYPTPPVPQIALVADTLYCTPAASYQWYFNGVAIQGANNGFYIPSQNGDYTAIVTSTDGCSSVSLPFNMTTVGMTTIAGVQLGISPNPFNDVIYISHPGETLVEIFSADGRLVYHQFLRVKDKSVIETTHLPKGAYYVRMSTYKEVFTQKMIKY